MYLVGDIGGTKAHLALVDESSYFKILREKKYPSKQYDSFSEILRDFLQEPVSAICIGIAGPIQNGICKVTNLPWIVRQQELEESFNTKVFLINDLEAKGLGIAGLKDEDLFVLQEGIPQPGKARAVIAAGTGLGVSGLYWDGEKYCAIASEGGHIDFAPRNEEEIALWRYLKKEYGHVSYEHLLSGPGLYTLYRFITRKETDYQGKEVSRVIVERALQKTDLAAREAVSLFVSLYGSMAANVALTFLALNGLYIGGGIAPHIIEFLNSGDFIKAFLDKGRLQPLLREIPVKVILNERAALIGAHAYVAMKRGLV